MLFDPRLQPNGMATPAKGFIFKGNHQLFPQMLPAMRRVNIHPLNFPRAIVVKHNGAAAHGVELLVANNHQNKGRFRQTGQIEQVIAFGRVKLALIAIQRRNQVEDIRVTCRFRANGIHGRLLVIFIST